MGLLRHLFLRLLPLGLIAGFAAVMLSSGGTIQSGRVEAINPASGPGSVYNAGQFESALAQDQNKGVEYVRETLDWSQIEASEGNYNWNAPYPYSAVFSSEKAQGLKVIAVLGGGPTYLSSNDSTQFLLRWANFVQAAVDQFGSQVDVWEIGSRLNTPTGMSPYETPSAPSSAAVPDPKLYAQMLKVASKIIKGADPNDEIWMGSLVGASSSSCAMNPLTFILEVNGAKGWNSFDSIEFTPARGAAAPETAVTSVNSACASSLPTANATMSGEVQSVQDLARQLGGKPVRIEGLGWSDDELNTLAANRAIRSGQVLADYLTRATVQIAGSNAVNSFFWQVDPADQLAAFTALGNLNSVMNGAKFESQPQGQTGSVYEYRFSRGSQWIIVAWHAQDGDSPVPVTLKDLPVNKLTAYAVDADSFTPANGTSIAVDASGSVTVMLNERPVVFLGETSDLGTAIQQDAQYQGDQLKYQIQLAAHRGVNQLKAAMLHELENLFDSAKQQAVQWGEDKLNQILN